MLTACLAAKPLLDPALRIHAQPVPQQAARHFTPGHGLAHTQRTGPGVQALRTGSNQGQRDAAQVLGLPPQETARRIGFVNALSGEARSSAISQLSRATGRNEAQVLHALETYNAATQVGTADGATAEAGREGTSVYGRTREAAEYDFAERSGKLDAQREVGTGYFDAVTTTIEREASTAALKGSTEDAQFFAEGKHAVKKAA